MISSAVGLTKLTKLHEPVGLVQFVVFEKIYSCLFIPNCTRNHVITYTNNIHGKIRDGLS